MKYFLFILLCTLFSLNCLAQQHQWIRGGGSHYRAPSGYNAREQVREMVTDEHGNVYILAEFMGSDSITFDNMIFPIYTNSVYRSKTALLSYTCEGKLRWGKIMSSDGGSKFAAMTYDKVGGIYIGSSVVSNSTSTYYLDDTAIVKNPTACWLLKYDTLGERQWIRNLGNSDGESIRALGNNNGQLMMRDTVVHFIKSVFESGAEIAPGIISERGIYDISFDRSGNLLEAKRLPIADTMLYVNIFNPSNIHEPSNTLHVSVFREDGWGGGVLTFDSMRNLISYDTFVSEPAYMGQRPVIFRDGDYQYVFGYFYGEKCTFKGVEFKRPYSSGAFSFIMKMDLDNNLIWKQLFYNTMPSGQGLTTCLEDLHNGRIILTGQIRGGLINREDTIFTQIFSYISRSLPIVILDTDGVVQTMDYWRHNNPVPSYDEGLEVACHNHNIYIGGRVTDSIWGGNSGYRSKGGPEDFLLAKYGYNCQCEPPLSDFKNDTALSGQPVRLNYTGSTSIDSLTWEYHKEIFSRSQNPNIILEAGTHKVCVTAYNACGPTRRCRELTVQCPKPTARYDFDITDNTLKMTYMGSQPVDSLRWFWGDGAQSSGHTAQHTYTRSGSYEVCLIAYLDCGSDTLCQQFHMECDAPVALFSQEKEGRTLKLHYTSATAPDSLLWSFGDGVQSQDNPATHTYDTTGWYEVCLRVWDGCGADSSCTSVYITEASAITSIEKEDLQLYPNPVTDKLYIHHNHPGAQLTIYDSRGRLCHSEVLMLSTSVINLRHLPAGMYALRYISPDGRVVYKKIVRQ